MHHHPDHANPLWPGAFHALLAAVLFGASTPFAKLLLGVIDPWTLAGLLYLGSGLGLGIVLAIRLLRSLDARRQVVAIRADLPWLFGAILAGGVIAPVLMMFGLAATSAASAALLLNLEAVLTALLAWVVFRENFDQRIALGMAVIVAGAVILTWDGRGAADSIVGPTAIALACFAWAIDNNLTRKVSLADPVMIAASKGIVAGCANLAIAFLRGGDIPSLAPASGAMAIGFLGYGVSLALFVLALRSLGTARTGAYFATGPFVGAVIALPLAGEPVTLTLVLGGGLMALGVWLHLTELHSHEHEHEPLTHAHSHRHDIHHQHQHGPDDSPGEPHTHQHSHLRLRHRHAHFPDAHHQHRH